MNSTITLSDIAAVFPGTSPAGASINDRGRGLPFYQGAREFGFRFPVPERFTDRPVKTAAEGDVLLSVRAPVGRVNVAAEECAIGRGVMAIRVHDADDRDFVAYALSAMGSAWDAHSTDGTMFANLSRSGLEKLSIPWPDERRRIAEVLRAVDDELARTGTVIRTIDDAISAAAAFASVESTSTQPAKLSDVASVTNGYSYSSSELVDESDVALVNLKNFGRDGSFRFDGLKPLHAQVKESQYLATGDLIVAKTDLTQNAEVVGRCMRMPLLPRFKGYVASLDVAVVRPSGDLSAAVLLGLLSLPEFREHCLGFTNGTTVLHLSKAAFATYELAVPENKWSLWLDERVTSLSQMQDVAIGKQLALLQLREFLLPRLVSGELRIAESEEMVGAAS